MYLLLEIFYQQSSVMRESYVKMLLYLMDVVKQEETQSELITMEKEKRLRLDVCIQRKLNTDHFPKQH
jgi:hypothetical protein